MRALLHGSYARLLELWITPAEAREIRQALQNAPTMYATPAVRKLSRALGTIVSHDDTDTQRKMSAVTINDDGVPVVVDDMTKET